MITIIKIKDDTITMKINTRSHILLFKLLNNNWCLVQIDMTGIKIYIIFGTEMRLQYFWYNDKWNYAYIKIYENFVNKIINDDDNKTNIKSINEHYISLIKKVLDDKSNDSKSSLPCSKSMYRTKFKKEIVE